MPIPAGAEVKLYWSLNAQLAMNVIGVEITGNPSFGQALADTIGAAIKATFTANLAPQIATSNSLVRVGIRDLRADHLPEFRDSGAAVAGTGAGDAMPGQAACCVTLRTAGAGKSFRGRTYISGFTEAANGASGLILAAASTAAVTFMQVVNQNLTSNGMRMAVLTRPQDDVVITKTTTPLGGPAEVKVLSHQTQKPGAVHTVTAFESRNAFWESQRKRVNGRGALPTSLDAAFKLAALPE